MNTRFFTGYLPGDATTAYAPATAERAALPRLCFDVMLRDSEGAEFTDKCVIDDAALQRTHGHLLTAGRAVIIEGEQTARPVYRNRVLVGYSREVRVRRIEIPNRSAPKTGEAEPATTGTAARADAP